MIKKVNFIYLYETPAGYIFPSVEDIELPKLFVDILDGEVEDFSNSILRVNPNKYNGVEFIYSKLLHKLINYSKKYKHNKDEIIVSFKSISECEYKKNEINIILIESSIYGNMTEELNYLIFKNGIVDDFLISKVKEIKNLYIWFIDDKEGSYDISPEFKANLKNFIFKTEVNKNKILFSNGNNFLKRNKGINYFPINPYIFEGSSEQNVDTFGNVVKSVNLENISESITNFRKKRFLCYNRNTSRLHRLLLVSKLNHDNILDNCIYSFYENDWFNDSNYRDYMNEYEGFNFSETEKDIMVNFINTKYPKHLDFDNQQSAAQSDNYLSNNQHYLDTYFSIVNETSISNEYCFITEKCIRPMLGMHPFLVFGNPHTLKTLKEFGFKTFDKFIDESYDLEFNQRKRFEKVYSEIIRLNGLSNDDVNKMYIQLIPILEHNKNLILEYHNNDGYVRHIIESLQKNVNRNLEQVL